MISNLVSPGINFAQDKLYEFQSTFLVDQKRVQKRNPDPVFGEVREICTTDQFIFVNRLLAVPVVVIDVALEALRPLCLAVESAAFAAFSLLAAFCHLMQCKGDEVKKDLRITLHNVYNAVKNLILTPLQAAVLPILAVGQLLVTVAEPLSSQKARDNFPSDARITTPLVAPSQWPQEPDTGKNGIKENQCRMYRDLRIVSDRNLTAGRVFAVPAAILDTVFEVAVPLIKTVVAVVKAAILVIFSFVAVGAGNRAQEFFEHSMALLNTAAHSLALCILKIATLPLKLIGQLVVTVNDPKNAMPCPRAFYRPMVGDSILTKNGIELEPVKNVAPYDPDGPISNEMDPWYGT